MKDLLHKEKGRNRKTKQNKKEYRKELNPSKTKTY